MTVASRGVSPLSRSGPSSALSLLSFMGNNCINAVRSVSSERFSQSKVPLIVEDH